MLYTLALLQEFKRHASPEIARQQEKYMKGRFKFFGICTPERRKLQQPFLG